MILVSLQLHLLRYSPAVLLGVQPQLPHHTLLVGAQCRVRGDHLRGWRVPVPAHGAAGHSPKQHRRQGGLMRHNRYIHIMVGLFESDGWTIAP